MTTTTPTNTPAHPVLRTVHPKLLIDGEWVDARSGKTRQSINPADGQRLIDVAEGGAEDVDRAVSAAHRALSGNYRLLKPFERQRILLTLADLVDEHAETIATLDTLDMGAPIAHTRRMALGASQRLRWYAAQTLSIRGETIPNSLPGHIVSYTVKEPVGVVGGITPWNGPINAAVWKIGPALATGCSLVLKPAETSPLSALLLGELCLEAGVPAGAINIVTGGGATAGAALAEHPEVAKVAFTGSQETGRAIVHASAGNLKRVSLELGGKSPHIIFGDADLDRAVPAAAMAVFNNSGQICVAGTRLLVERTVHEEVLARLARFGSEMRIGNGLDPSTQIGPLASEQQLDRVVGYLNIGHDEGARAIIGGSRLATDGLADGYFVPPTIFTDVRDDMRVAREEIFGPVISVLPFDDVDEAALRANATPYGLASGVWTESIRRAHQLAARLESGTVWVNGYGLFDPAVPFGGYKLSGYGRENGTEQLDEYQNVKSVWIAVD
jgi:aldehyde dehydrogenase (NAD+)